MPSTGTSRRGVMAAFLAVVVSFIVAGSFEQRASHAIDVAADAMIENATPSISHLAALRGDVRQAEYLLDQWVDAAASEHPSGRAELDAALEHLQAELRAYRALPKFPGESGHLEALEAALGAFDRTVEHAESLVELRAPREAQATMETRVRDAANKVADVSVAAIDFNANEGRELGLEIKQTRERAIVVSYALDLLCALIAGGAAWLVWRRLQRSDLLRDEHAKMLELRAAELESFSGRVAHDILSPLTGVRLALTLVERQSSDPRTQKILDRGQRSLSRVESLTDALLLFARAGAKPAAEARAEVEPLVEGVLEELRPEADAASIDLVVGTPLRGVVACAPGILTSILSNLVRNALKYMGDSTRRRVTLRVFARGERLRFEVHDTGPGLPPGVEAYVWEPYVRGHRTQPGLGLGLATVKRLADGHGGAAGVVSRSGEGCLFWVELPAAREGVAAGAAEEAGLLHH